MQSKHTSNVLDEGSDMPTKQLPKFLEGVTYSARDTARFKQALRNSSVVLSYMRENEADLKIDDYLKMMRIELDGRARPSVLSRIKGKYDKARWRQESLELAIYVGSR